MDATAQPATIDAERVAIPASVAGDLIAALSAENVRLRAELDEARKSEQFYKDRADTYRKESESRWSRCCEAERKVTELRGQLRKQAKNAKATATT